MEESKSPSPALKKRRTILGWLLGGSLTAFVAPILYVAGRYMGFKGVSGGATQATLLTSDVTPEHPSKLISINDDPVLVIYQPDAGVRAFTAKCTHLGCTVSYKPEMPGFYCKCHKGMYDKNGINIPGTKPKSPLTELTVMESVDEIKVLITPKQKSL
jgi:Rieske Fe-S protein